MPVSWASGPDLRSGRDDANSYEVAALRHTSRLHTPSSLSHGREGVRGSVSAALLIGVMALLATPAGRLLDVIAHAPNLETLSTHWS